MCIICVRNRYIFFKLSLRHIFVNFFVGEVCAGKSSLLNLIIGDNILPKNMFQCTSTICEIYNSVEKRAVIIDEKGSEICLNDVTSTTLSEYITFDENDENETPSSYKKVDIYWPLNRLKVNLSL